MELENSTEPMEELDGAAAEAMPPQPDADGEGGEGGAQSGNNAAGAGAEARSFAVRDVMDFIGKYPEFDDEAKLGELENNPAFRRFCGSRFGREPLSELYGTYLELVGNAGRAAVAKAAGRSTRSTGGGTGGGAVLDPAQRAALNKWNEEHPEMAMTAKEYLGR